MANILKVVKPFFTMEQGDEFELSENGNYVYTCSSEYNNSDDSNDIKSVYTASYEISPDYAAQLIREGYISTVSKKDSDFVNVFDEIDTLYNKYIEQLENLEDEFENQPACLKVEKETVLKNMVKLLDHLNSLKK